MKMTPAMEAYTRQVAAEIGRDPAELIAEGEQHINARLPLSRRRRARRGHGRDEPDLPRRPVRLRRRPLAGQAK